jgi:TolB-like protein/DNA-binding winged helix-turn-helix (wHTH) protein/Flp pilus assembly protein TadD
MSDKGPNGRPRFSNIARLDTRRGRRSAREEKPCIESAIPYVDSVGEGETKGMLSVGQPIDFDVGFRVGDFEVYPKRLALVRDGHSVRLEPKVMAVLVHLARHAGEVVTRNEFADEVWRGRVVSDEVLSRDISILRSQLGDDAKEPDYVLTIPRVGYRLIGKVRPLKDPEPEPAIESTATPERVAGAAGPADVTPLVPVASQPDSPVSRIWPGRSRAILLGVAVAVAFAAAIAFLLWPGSQALDRTTIAVLPFVSLSEAHDDEFFSDGLSEEIMHALSGVTGIRVVAKTSSFSFRNSTADIRDIGRQLGAGSVLEGSVRRDGSRLRIIIQMIDANTGMQEWSQTYDRRLADIFEVQNQISRAIAGRLVGNLATNALPNTIPTTSIEAYTLFLRANHLLRQRGAVPLTRAIELFEQTISLDPKFARAYSGLAQAYTVQPSYTGTSEKAGHRLALDAQDRAEGLGEDPIRASGMRGYLHFRSREWQTAEDDFDVALAANPTDAEALQWQSQFFASVGWMERARLAAEAAVAADPLSPAANQRAGVVSLWINDPAAAQRYFTIASEVGIPGPGLPEAWLAFLLSQGRIEEARKTLVETQQIRKQATGWIEPALAAITKTGSASDAVEALGRDYRAGNLGTPMYVGALFFIGDVDGLFAAMKDVIASGEPFDVEVFFGERGRVMRGDARFIPLMTQLGLVDFWDSAGWPDVCARGEQQIVCR